MRRAKKNGLLAVLPLVVSTALVLSACGGGSDDADNAQQNPAPVTDTSTGAVTGSSAGTGTTTGTGTSSGSTSPMGPMSPSGTAP